MAPKRSGKKDQEYQGVEDDLEAAPLERSGSSSSPWLAVILFLVGCAVTLSGLWFVRSDALAAVAAQQRRIDENFQGHVKALQTLDRAQQELKTMGEKLGKQMAALQGGGEDGGAKESKKESKKRAKDAKKEAKKKEEDDEDTKSSKDEDKDKDKEDEADDSEEDEEPKKKSKRRRKRGGKGR